MCLIDSVLSDIRCFVGISSTIAVLRFHSKFAPEFLKNSLLIHKCIVTVWIEIFWNICIFILKHKFQPQPWSTLIPPPCYGWFRPFSWVSCARLIKLLAFYANETWLVNIIWSFQTDSIDEENATLLHDYLITFPIIKFFDHEFFNNCAPYGAGRTNPLMPVHSQDGAGSKLLGLQLFSSVPGASCRSGNSDQPNFG